jgi:3-isopropylmalate/(R)-2-methylmalate dehydratase small subunit
MKNNEIVGSAFVLQDDVNTDHIITAEYMKINPSSSEGYKKLGALAMCGLPQGYPPFIDKKTGKSKYNVIVAGKNFGCGSSREHAPVALGASGIQAVIAESFARIFFRNCISTGELLPIEINQSVWQTLSTGVEVTINLDKNLVSFPSMSLEVEILPLGPMREIVKAGGLFSYSRLIGRI